MSVNITCDKKEMIVWKGRLRPKREEESREKRKSWESWESWESDHGGLHHHLIIMEQCP